ncbi:MAG TPA: ATP-binding protein [Herpetosiphon sp.]|uniref:Anti-sigma regulatory factor, serine/threonine protein kinase n=2 Tax=Herpetosiphon TaxID=64 RepID=A9B5N3_HERA2|nr:ATP-binding protein [Herpetosiphon sp.]ABX04266.1 putative anti-sigma regulatory factor, serine/threonine protein kinase [Herpetosiphon aurantiacus DSM 785]MCA0353792.1 ATP-binding protein [Chloroflexota bacterium]HBW52615.1 ATP-binding protein [Herpetosiphon sp.]
MAQTQATIELIFPSQLGYEKIAREAIGTLARNMGFDPERVEDLRTALSEACINAIEHGNQRQVQRRIHITCTISRNRLVLVISDEGLRFHPSQEIEAATIEQKLAGLASARGMGLMLIEQLVDECGFLPSRPGQGNRFRLAMYNPPRRHGSASA